MESNIDFILDHRAVILEAYLSCNRSQTETWRILTGTNKSGEPILDDAGNSVGGKLPRIAEVMKFDSFRTYLNLLESLGKRLDPGMVQSQIQNIIRIQFSELDKRLIERISVIEQKLDLIAQLQASVESLIAQPAQIQVSPQSVHTQTTQPVTQIKASPKPSQPYKPSEISLHSIRKKKGLSQSQLALSLGVSRNRVANWESGRSEIPDDVLKKLS